MPFCQVSKDTTLHYITNSPGGDVRLFDHSKPTILLLHPTSFDSSWFKPQFREPRITNSYNLIAIDSRNAGHTRSPYSAHRDSYVDAADLAFACELLQLPPVHVFAVQINGVWAAIRLAVVFPDKVLSLCLLSVPSDVPLDWTPKAYGELIQCWCFPPDLDTFEQANLEMSYFLFSGQIMPEQEDEVVAFWQMTLPPRKRRTVLELTFGRCPPTKEEYARIRIPTLLMMGDNSPVHLVEDVRKTHEAIEGSQFFVMRGAPEVFVFLPQYTSITHRVFCNFLSRQPPPPPYTRRTPNLVRLVREALVRLAEISGDPSVAMRLPEDVAVDRTHGVNHSPKSSHTDVDLDPIMFSMWKPDILAQNQAHLDQLAVGEEQAFSPVDEHGLPLRKFSSRHDDEWTSAGFDMLHNSGKAITGIMLESTS